MREKYESLSLTVLRELAKARGMKNISALRKGQLVDAMLVQDEKDEECCFLFIRIHNRSPR